MSTNARLKQIVLNDDNSVKHYLLNDGRQIEADLYISAMPGKPLKCITNACKIPVDMVLIVNIG